MYTTHTGKVVVDDPDTMEHIVNSNPLLQWDGWDVIFVSPKKSSFANPSAKYIDGGYRVVQRYTPGHEGWIIPKGFLNVEG